MVWAEISNRMVSVGPVEKVTCEPRLERGREGVC